MNRITACLITILAFGLLTFPSFAAAQQAPAIPAPLVTPNGLESSLGRLEFRDGAPRDATVQKVYDYLDLMHGVEAFVNAFQGASTMAIMKGFQAAGVPNNEVLIFSGLMDAKSLFLTANADTPYFVGILDMTEGPIVLEAPPAALGTIDDMWFNWVVDFGFPGPDRGAGGKYLLVPPGYEGELPDGGFFVRHVRTTRALMLGRAFLENDDPKPTIERIKSTIRIYPYLPGGAGISIGAALQGKATLALTPTGRLDVSFLRPPPAPRFHEGTGLVVNTIPPSDFSYYQMLNELVQSEPATAMDNAEVMGSLAAIGIVKGKPFNPDTRMRRILTDAAAIGSAAGRILNWNPRPAEEFYYYPNSAWTNMLFVGGYNFETPPPEVSSDGKITLNPATGARTLNSRTTMFFAYTGITPAMIMRLRDIGSAYLVAFRDSRNEYFDGAKTYKVTLPVNIPAGKFWSLTVYDNQSRSMLDTPQRYPRAGSQSYPTPAGTASADGTTTVYFGPRKPDGVAGGNWIQTDPNKGWFVILRLYSPLDGFFTKSWRISEIEQVG